LRGAAIQANQQSRSRGPEFAASKSSSMDAA
jgi:hypothetical protein